MRFWIAFFCLHIAQGAFALKTIYVNAKVKTMDPEKPLAQAFIVDNGRFSLIGSNEDVKKHIEKDVRVVDLENRSVIPGIIESHAHFFGLGFKHTTLELSSATSPEGIAELLRAKIAKAQPGEWILGRGWDQNKWLKQQFPTHDILTKWSPSNPVVFMRVDGHAYWCNAAAMNVAGIAKETESPTGGQILKDEQGNPTGVFIDAAMNLIRSKIPEPNSLQNREAALLAQEEALQYGVTSFADAGVNIGMISELKSLYETNQLKLRIYAMINGGDEQSVNRYLASGPESNLYGSRFSVRAIKIMGDGALGSRGAALLRPYDDDPNHLGLIVTKKDAIKKLAKSALEKGFQVAVHAIGDGANRMVLDVFGELDREKLKKARFRIEHAQVVDPLDQKRFSELGVIASMQPTHCTSDAPWVVARLGKKRSEQGAYVWRNLLNLNTKLVFGSDAPVESVNPFEGLYSAMARQSDELKEPFYPQQVLSLDEALRAYTKGAAFGEFSEHEKGQIKAGYLADFLVLDTDLEAVSPDKIRKTKVLKTYISGELVYEKKEMDSSKAKRLD